MQKCLVGALFGVLALASLVEGSIASSKASAQARAWVQNHPAAQEDDLAELKTQNPEAYAIVKALLTKRSLGLLDPKHPSASFAAPPASSQVAVPAGAAAFAKFASPSEISTSKSVEPPMYPDASVAPVHRDWLNWKPQDSAANDEAMVQSVLGAVAELKGQGAPSTSTSSSALGAHQVDFETQATIDENSDVNAAAAAPPAATQGNPYLRGTNLGSDAQPTSASQHDNLATSEPPKNDYLTSFSWDDEKPTAAPAQLAQQKQAVKKRSSGPNVLTAWLTGGAAGQRAVQQQPGTIESKHESPEKSSNPYIAALW